MRCACCVVVSLRIKDLLMKTINYCVDIDCCVFKKIVCFAKQSFFTYFNALHAFFNTYKILVASYLHPILQLIMQTLYI